MSEPTRSSPDTTGLDFFSENVDAWGAAEWFNRLAKAVRRHGGAVRANDEGQMAICQNVAISSAWRLVNDYEQQVRASLQPATPTEDEDNCACGGGDVSGHDSMCPERHSSAGGLTPFYGAQCPSYPDGVVTLSKQLEAVMAIFGRYAGAAQGSTDDAADAARYRHLKEHASYYYAEGHNPPTPREFGISWEHQDCTPERPGMDWLIDQEIEAKRIEALEDATEDASPLPSTKRDSGAT